jgi:hypothetical protein
MTKLQTGCVYKICRTPCYADAVSNQIHKLNANAHINNKRTPTAMLLVNEPREGKVCEAAETALGRIGNALLVNVACSSCPLLVATDGLVVIVVGPDSDPMEEDETCGDAAGDDVEKTNGDVD